MQTAKQTYFSNQASIKIESILLYHFRIHLPVEKSDNFIADKF